MSSVVTDCICNIGYTGPNGGNCEACEAGTFKTVAGTAIYMAPEMASHYVRLCGNDTSSVLSYGQEIDIWSYGIVLYVMATGSSPYWKTGFDDLCQVFFVWACTWEIFKAAR